MFLGFFAKRRDSSPHQTKPDDLFDLDRPLLQLSPADFWRIRDACEGVAVFGATGSGKTSGSGQALAKVFLGAGFGGLVLTAKNDERSLWERYAQDTGRADDILIFSPQHPWRFNFLNYELSRPGRGAGYTENIANLFSTVLEIAERKGRTSGDQYWQRTTKQLVRNAIDLVVAASGAVSLPALHRVITSAPLSIEQSHNQDWQANSYCFYCIVQGDEREKDPVLAHDFDLAARYWLSEFPTIAEKTRSIIVSMFTSMADCFLRGILRETFCTDFNLTPEMSLDGKIIILDMPVKEFGELGQFAQVLFKYVWQQAVERRNVAENPRPVFLWADESQNFYTSYDREFQSTARSSRACTVYLTQNLPNYYAALGSDRSGKAETEGFLGNLQTKIFHANSDRATNEWAADLCAKSWQFRHNFGAAGNQYRSSQSAGVSESLDYDILPGAFSRLKTGGPDHGLFVEGIIFQSGRVWKANGKTYLKTRFAQSPNKLSKRVR